MGGDARREYRAVVCVALGPPDRLQVVRLPRVPLAPDQVRVAIRAAGVNFPDALMVQGRYQHRPELPFVPGIEAAGIVVEVGAEVADIVLGQRVILRLGTGGYAEEAVAAAAACASGGGWGVRLSMGARIDSGSIRGEKTGAIYRLSIRAKR